MWDRSITKIGSTRKRASLGKKVLSSVSITLNFKYFDLCKCKDSIGNLKAVAEDEVWKYFTNQM